MFSRIAAFAGFVALFLVLTGCWGYRLGSSLPSNIASVHVRPFNNRSGEPDIETEATSATLREFQRDGTLRVANADEADAIVETTITSVRLEPLRYSQESASETTEFRLLIIANMALTERKTGKVLATHTALTGKTTFDSLGDLTSAMQQAIEPAARDLAHAIVVAVVETW